LSLLAKPPFQSKIQTFAGDLDFNGSDANEEDEVNEDRRMIKFKIQRDV
jgi:hypothetical protein